MAQDMSGNKWALSSCVFTAIFVPLDESQKVLEGCLKQLRGRLDWSDCNREEKKMLDICAK